MTTPPAVTQLRAAAPPVVMQALPMLHLDDPEARSAEAVRERDAALRAMYGDACPLLSHRFEAATEAGAKEQYGQYIEWISQLWASRDAAMVRPLWIAQRNRDFYKGRQWLDSKGPGKPWEVPRAPSDAVRKVVNVTRAALDLRAQIVSEQRPGYKIEPTNRDSASRKKAQAKELILNYLWKAADMEQIHAEAAYWAGTDGVAFVETRWDVNAGPWYEMSLEPGFRTKLGDIRKRVLRIEEVRVSPNATASVPPLWLIVRRPVPAAEAVATWGEAVALEGDRASGSGMSLGTGGAYADRTDDQLLNTPVVDEWACYVEPSTYLPEGLEVHAVGKVVTYLGPLLFGVIPVVRFADGSKDPAYYPEPVMNNWVDDQVAINQVVSKIVEVVRKTAGGAYLARPQTIVRETQMLGSIALIEVQGSGALDDIAKYIPPSTVGQDAFELLKFSMQQFEQKSGWNDATRGSFKPDMSGRAILAVREQVERTFIPLVQAFARSACQDAKVSLAAVRWGYDIPRQIAVTGKHRIDLVRYISAEDIDGVNDVDVDPQTLMPIPRSLRHFMLDNDLARGLITPQQYMRNRKIAWMGDIEPGDEDDRARAYRIAELIRSGVPEPMLPPVLFMDDPNVHMDVLRREILLNDDFPDEIRSVAWGRFMAYHQMLQMQASAAMAPPLAGTLSSTRPNTKGLSMNPREQPLLGARPGIAAGPLTDEQIAGQMGDTLFPM